ncbi:MAG: hypothetical protein JST54_09915 [Deltaproteobacteria bacterium]|nr:hypothetical protein [Deltaproteobacteria bacterium]
MSTEQESHAPGPDAVRVVHYWKGELSENREATIQQYRELLGVQGTTWFDFPSGYSTRALETLAEALTDRHLALFEGPRLNGMIRLESYDNCALVVLPRSQFFDSGDNRAPLLLVGSNWMISSGWPRATCLAGVQDRLQRGEFLRARGPDFLAYAVLQQALSSLLPEVERLSGELQAIEEEPPSPAALERLHATRQGISHLRHAVVPLRDAAAGLARELQGSASAEARQALRDLYEVAEAPLEDLDELHATTATIIDISLSTVSFRTNEVMRVLTIISTIFLPMSFITSYLGMNVEVPLAQWRYGYPFAWCLMIASAGIMFGYFKHKGWLGPPLLPRHRARPPHAKARKALH